MRRGLVLALLLAAACASQPSVGADSAAGAPAGAPSLAAQSEELGRRWAAWRAGRPDRYRFVYSPRCFCLPERLTIEVRGDSARLVAAEGDTAAIARRRESELPTVDSLFAMLDDALQADPAEMRVTWDPAMHYPRDAWVDRDRNMADEEFGFAVDSLVRID